MGFVATCPAISGANIATGHLKMAMAKIVGIIRNGCNLAATTRPVAEFGQSDAQMIYPLSLKAGGWNLVHAWFAVPVPITGWRFHQL